MGAHLDQFFQCGQSPWEVVESSPPGNLIVAIRAMIAFRSFLKAHPRTMTTRAAMLGGAESSTARSGPFFSRLPLPVVLSDPWSSPGLAAPFRPPGFHLKRVFFRLRSAGSADFHRIQCSPPSSR